MTVPALLTLKVTCPLASCAGFGVTLNSLSVTALACASAAGAVAWAGAAAVADLGQYARVIGDDLAVLHLDCPVLHLDCHVVLLPKADGVRTIELPLVAPAIRPLREWACGKAATTRCLDALGAEAALSA